MSVNRQAAVSREARRRSAYNQGNAFTDSAKAGIVIEICEGERGRNHGKQLARGRGLVRNGGGGGRI